VITIVALALSDGLAYPPEDPIKTRAQDRQIHGLPPRKKISSPAFTRWPQGRSDGKRVANPGAHVLVVPRLPGLPAACSITTSGQRVPPSDVGCICLLTRCR
jgi:hypothetical protein